MKIKPTVKMSDDEYFVPSPCNIPMPPPLEDEFELPPTMVEQIISKRLRHYRPFYHIPPLPLKVIREWTPPESGREGYRVLVYRQHIFLETSLIVHDYLFVNTSASITGWIQKHVAYYYTETVPWPYDEISPTATLDMMDKPTPRSPSSHSMNILSCCSASYLDLQTQQPVRPRVMKRLVKKM
jgi:hypothetical protein